MNQFFLNFYFIRNGCLCWRWVMLLSVVLLQACNTNDLSDLKDRVNANLQNTSGILVLELSLTASQVVPSLSVVSNSEARAKVEFDLTSNAVAAEVNTNQLKSAVLSVQIARGFAGKIGHPIADLIPSDNPDVWRLPDGFVLTDSDTELLFRGGVYLQVGTVTQIQGAARSQLIVGYQELMINSLSADQVVDTEVNSVAAGTSYLTVDYLSGDVHGSVWLSDDINPQQVALRRGIAGTDGEVIMALQPDSAIPGLWVIPDNTQLTLGSIDELITANMYTQVTSSQYANGELRGQVYPSYYYVDVVELSGMNLVPQVMTQASGKAYVTLDGISGYAQAIVKLRDINPGSVSLFRVNNLNDTNNWRLLFPLEMQQNNWQLAPSSVFEKSDFVNLGKNRLLIIVTSQDFPLGEIGGWL